MLTSGQVGRDPVTGALVDGTDAQTATAIENLRLLLRSVGADLRDVVRVLVFLAPEADRERYNAAYVRYFSKDPPARTTIQAGGLATGCLIEMEAIAILPDPAEGQQTARPS
jgi:2-iminobutanoate/2-iminopropanoate deaminase